MSDETIIGIAYCEHDDCRQKIKVHQRHRGLVGKPVRCPKCRRFLTLVVEPASEADRVEVESQAPEEKRKVRVRRGKSELRQIETDKLIAGFRQVMPRLQAFRDSNHATEGDISDWVADALVNAFGYERSDLSFQRNLLGKFADILVSHEGHCLYVVEVKKLGVSLGKQEVHQAVEYAMKLSIPWAVLTNGDIWRLYRIITEPGKAPVIHDVFDVALLDEDGVSDGDADLLYLLTKRCMTSREIEDEWEKEHASSKPRLVQALLSPRVVQAMRIELNHSYKADFGKIAGLDDAVTREELKDCFFPMELEQ